LIAGCGYVGTALGQRLAAEGSSVLALRRRTAGLPPSLIPLAADLARPETLRDLPARVDVVCYAAAADRSDEASYREVYVQGLRNLLGALGEVGRLVYVSSTSVHAQSAGEWVDEQSPTQPSSFRGRLVLEGERIARTSGLPTTRVRFGGIYGPGRTRLLDRVRAGEARFRRDHYTNRIHRDDCVGVLHHVAHLARPDPVYVAVDEEPALEQTVLEWLAERLGAPAPRAASVERARSGGTVGPGSKRCSSKRLRAGGYRFAQPSFREGYASLIAP
jgi:nucleoside-diphosphate-sugar epimerase